jgi:cyclase
MDADGTQQGYDLAMLAFARTRIHRPLIASGGAGRVDHLEQAILAGENAMLLASILHQGATSLPELKSELTRRGVSVRWPI